MRVCNFLIFALFIVANVAVAETPDEREAQYRAQAGRVLMSPELISCADSLHACERTCADAVCYEGCTVIYTKCTEENPN